MQRQSYLRRAGSYEEPSLETIVSQYFKTETTQTFQPNPKHEAQCRVPHCYGWNCGPCVPPSPHKHKQRPPFPNSIRVRVGHGQPRDNPTRLENPSSPLLCHGRYPIFPNREGQSPSPTGIARSHRGFHRTPWRYARQVRNHAMIVSSLSWLLHSYFTVAPCIQQKLTNQPNDTHTFSSSTKNSSVQTSSVQGTCRSPQEISNSHLHYPRR